MAIEANFPCKCGHTYNYHLNGHFALEGDCWGKQADVVPDWCKKTTSLTRQCKCILFREMTKLQYLEKQYEKISN